MSRQAALDCGVAVVGPNCEGLWSVRSRVLLTFGAAARRCVLLRAPIAVLSQSGAMAGAVARHLQNDGVGCAYMVSVGNETVLTIADYLAWMIEQDDVRVVALFIEGLRDGARLLRLIEQATARGVRVVALKCGNTRAGMQAAASHTGKMASDYVVYRDLLAQAGAVLVDSLTDLVAAAEVLVTAPLPLRRGVAGDLAGGAAGGVSVFSIPGGTRAMTADHLDAQRVPLATFSRNTVLALTAALPEYGGVENPTDLTGQVLSFPGLFDECLLHIARDAQTEALVVQVANRGPRDVMERLELLGRVSAELDAPVVATFLGDTLPAEDRARLRQHRVLCARDPAEAARMLGWLYRARDAAKAAAQAAAPTATFATHPESAAHAVLAAPTSWPETAAWLQAAGVGQPAWCMLKPGALAATAAQHLRYPVAVKALPEDCEHKTERGLLALNVPDAAAVDVQAARIRAVLGSAEAGVLVQEMAPAGVEVVLAAVQNPDFGPVLAIGLGGVAVELFGDLAWLALPTHAQAVRAAIGGLRLATVLQGFRGQPPADIDALVDTVLRFGAAFVATVPAPAEVEINPLIVLPAGVLDGVLAGVPAGVLAGVLAVDALFKP